MVSSADVPSQFVINWKPYSRNSPSRSTALDKSDTSHKLCLACDSCRQARVKCSGGNPCRRCMNHDGYCHYSVSLRSGRTKAARHRKRQNNNSNTQSTAATTNDPPTATIDTNQNSETPQETISTSIDPVMALDDFAVLQTSDSPTNNSALTPVSSFRDIFACDFDNMDLSNIFSSGNSGSLGRDLGIAIDTPFPRPSSSSRLSFSGQITGEPSPGFILTLPPVGSSPLTPPCSCFKTQLRCISHLCDPMENKQGGLDIILETTRNISEQINQLLSCGSCLKGPTSFSLTTLLLQRLVCLFCYVEKNGPVIMKTTKLGIGMFQLSEEEDKEHKKLLITTAAKRLDAMANSFYELVTRFQQGELPQQRITCEILTEMGRFNLKWVLDAIQKIRLRLKTIITVVSTGDWC